MSEIATTIFRQIRAMDKLAFMRWGARTRVATNEGLKFKTSGLVKWKGWVHVKYDAARDLYDIDFFRIRGVDIKMDKQLEGVYFDSLVEIIDRQVG